MERLESQLASAYRTREGDQAALILRKVYDFRFVDRRGTATADNFSLVYTDIFYLVGTGIVAMTVTASKLYTGGSASACCILDAKDSDGGVTFVGSGNVSSVYTGNVDTASVVCTGILYLGVTVSLGGTASVATADTDAMADLMTASTLYTGGSASASTIPDGTSDGGDTEVITGSKVYTSSCASARTILDAMGTDGGGTMVDTGGNVSLVYAGTVNLGDTVSLVNSDTSLFVDTVSLVNSDNSHLGVTSAVVTTVIASMLYTAVSASGCSISRVVRSAPILSMPTIGSGANGRRTPASWAPR